MGEVHLGVVWLVVCVLAAGGGGAGMGILCWRRRERLSRLEGRLVELEEALARKRHTNRTDAGILDALADLVQVEFNLAEMEARGSTSLRVIRDARARLGVVREGPYAYEDEGGGP